MKKKKNKKGNNYDKGIEIYLIYVVYNLNYKIYNGNKVIMEKVKDILNMILF